MIQAVILPAVILFAAYKVYLFDVRMKNEAKTDSKAQKKNEFWIYSGYDS